MQSVVNQVIKWIFGDPNSKFLKSSQSIVDGISALESDYSQLSDTELAGKTTEFKARLDAGETLDDLLIESFAVVREAGKRTLNLRHFDVQLLGGIALHQGRIAEMKTGEGKTLVSTLPAYLNALAGKGVYIITVNDYLAKRDSQWMGQIFRFLGLSVGLIQSSMDPSERIHAYSCDITYGTNNEFGFDYLRDNLAFDLAATCQKRRHFAIVDEVDSILIDEARTPLIISGPVEQSPAHYMKLAKVTKKLVAETHFTIDEKQKNIILTNDGEAEIESAMGIDSMFTVQNMEIGHIAIQCLKARHLYHRDIDYVVKDNEVIIVDEFTGRLLDGRRYSDGLHQAIEAVENVPIREESQTLASITFQNYFRLFPKLAGMTGTAKTEESEFIKIYNLDVITIPTHKPMVRIDFPDIVYKSKDEKMRAIVTEISECHSRTQPVLAGTISIENSEKLSKLLKEKAIPHSVLNAKFHEQEAQIISKAGQAGSVTIATNMAGRGTDIVLGDGVKELGGLHIIGTERHESRRIDNQLRGRAGRQGDPGSSRFYVSLEDDLMRLFGSDRIIKVMDTLGLPPDTPIEHNMVTKSIARAQKKVEQYYFGIRKQVIQYDDVLNKQRETIYELRRQLLEGTNVVDKVKDSIKTVVDQTIKTHWDRPTIATDAITEITTSLSAIISDNVHLNPVDAPVETDFIRQELCQILMEKYKQKCDQYPPDLFEAVVTKGVILSTVDRKWKDHLHTMDVLRAGIGLRAWGQKDPLTEYKMEGFGLFFEMVDSIALDSIETIFRSQIMIEALPESPEKTKPNDRNRKRRDGR